MRVAILALAAVAVVAGIVAIRETHSLRPPRKEEPEATCIAGILKENDRKYQASLNQRHALLLEEHAALHEKLMERYEDWIEERKRIRRLYPELDLPDPELDRLIFLGNDVLHIDSTETQIDHLQHRVDELRHLLSNRSARSTPSSRSVPSGRE